MLNPAAFDPWRYFSTPYEMARLGFATPVALM